MISKGFYSHLGLRAVNSRFRRTLAQLAELFSISVEDLLSDPDALPGNPGTLEKAMTQVSEKALKRKPNKNIILALSSTLVWFIALLAFVILSSFAILEPYSCLLFFYAIPANAIVLLSLVVVFMAAGIISPQQMVAGFSNRGMITVALLFLVSEGIRQSGALSTVVKKLLPSKGTSVTRAQMRILPIVSAFSAFLNNTPVVVIFAPILKNWSRKVGLSCTKFLIPLSYATILGGLCTLIGTSTNLVVHGMMIDRGLDGLKMFDLAYIGIPITVAGLIYILVVSKRLLPADRPDNFEDEEAEVAEDTGQHIVEVVLASRFPGLKRKLKNFDFKRRYGAEVKEIRQNGQVITEDLGEVRLQEGDTLVLLADSAFTRTWGDSSVFLMMTNGQEIPAGRPMPAWKKWTALALLILMIAGATIGELPYVQERFPGVKMDMFFFASVTAVVMAWLKLFPPKKYTKYISWDILITIACAFAISAAMEESGLAALIATFIQNVSGSLGAWGALALLYLVTLIITELITNNAAAALAFPLALETAAKFGADPMPFFIAICIAASAGFATPIGYQTNLIVQGAGNYKFTDFVKIGLPLDILVMVIAVTLIPLIWPF